MKSTKTFFITGANSGFGRALSAEALADGHQVIGTVRSDSARLAFEAQCPGRAFGRILDVTNFDAVDGVVADVETAVGPIDVLVNNAGYGYEGILEESSLEAMRRQFDVNVFGAVAVTKALLPYLRQRRRGHIINITSMGGFVTMPGIAYYCGSKFALEGISEVLGKELRSFDIAVTAVAPGSAARAILELVAHANPPAHLFLGSDALTLVRDKLGQLTTEITAWERVTRLTDG
jgi:NAD(P)-dependent dehydrogenase (short-subunit alcohol dehydrogenase family)